MVLLPAVCSTSIAAALTPPRHLSSDQIRCSSSIAEANLRILVTEIKTVPDGRYHIRSLSDVARTRELLINPLERPRSRRAAALQAYYTEIAFSVVADARAQLPAPNATTHLRSTVATAESVQLPFFFLFSPHTFLLFSSLLSSLRCLAARSHRVTLPRRSLPARFCQLRAPCSRCAPDPFIVLYTDLAWPFARATVLRPLIVSIEVPAACAVKSS